MTAAGVAARATNRKVGGVTGLSLSINDRQNGRPRPLAVNQWQQHHIANSVDEQLTQKLILEPGEVRVDQSVTLEMQLR